MSSNLQNSIWPNEGGTLGQIKVQIPTGTANDPWPTGDALVHNFVFNEGKLVGFVDTKALIANESKSTTFPYEYVNISLPSIAEGEMTYNYDQCTYVVFNGKVLKGYIPSGEELEIITKKYLGCKTLDDIIEVDPDYKSTDIINGVWEEGLGDLEQGGDGNYNGGMFYNCSQLTTFSSHLPSLTNGTSMFNNCSNLTSFSSHLPSLTNGQSMFNNCSNLKTFNSGSSGLPVNLTSLTNGQSMFNNCSNLKTFNSDLYSLTNGKYMFYNCSQLTTFSSDLTSLTDGYNMFASCSQLISFSSHLPSLTDGEYMFYNCSQLTTFSSHLTSLTDGEYMFTGCKLSVESVENIANSLPTVSNNNPLHLGIDLSSVPSTYAAIERPSITYKWYENPELGDFIPHLQTIVDKGWVITLNNKDLERWGNDLGSNPY